MKIVPEAARPKTVLFVSERNSCRSQIAAAIFNWVANPSVVQAQCAGIRPARRVHPALKAAMREIGIDLRVLVPLLASPDRVASAQLLITMGCSDSCPAPPTLPRDEWPLPDQPGPLLEEVRQLRDEIELRVRRLIAAHPWT